jgi:protein-disulfide isomerase
VEFSDYQCPFCGRHFRETLPEIEEKYLVTGKLKYIFWDFPLQSIHREAFRAHEAAHCAGEQEKYWEMHHRLFSNQDSLSPSEMPKHAQAINLDGARFQDCLHMERHSARIRVAVAEAYKNGVTATPTFFLVTLNALSGRATVVEVIRGAQPYTHLGTRLKRRLWLERLARASDKRLSRWSTFFSRSFHICRFCLFCLMWFMVRTANACVVLAVADTY